MSNKSLFNITLFKKEVKTLSVLAVVNFVYLAFYFPFRSLQIIMDITSGNIDMYNFVNTYRNFANPSFIFVEAIFMIAASLMLFSAEKNSKTIEVLVTAPFSRLQIYATKIITGMVLFILPSIVMYFLTYMIVSTNPLISSVIYLNETLQMFITGIIIKLTIFSYFVMISMLFGSTAASLICGTIFSAMPFGIYALIIAFIKGGDAIDNQLGQIISRVTPSAHLFYVASELTSKYVLLAYCILYLFAGYILFEMYKMEKNGEFLTFKWTEPVFKVGFFICMALLGGIIFEAMLYSVSSFTLINKSIGLVLGSLAGYFIPKYLINNKRAI